MQTRVAILGVLLTMIGSGICIYGISAMNTGDLLSNTSLVVVGIFLGMAGLFVLLSQLFPRFSLLR